VGRVSLTVNPVSSRFYRPPSVQEQRRKCPGRRHAESDYGARVPGRPDKDREHRIKRSTLLGQREEKPHVEHYGRIESKHATRIKTPRESVFKVKSGRRANQPLHPAARS